MKHILVNGETRKTSNQFKAYYCSFLLVLGESWFSFVLQKLYLDREGLTAL